MFPTDKQTGNNLMRLLLESLVTWGTRFPTNSKKEPTKFRKTLMKLQEEKVVLPKDFLYYQPNARKSERAETPQGPSEGTIPPSNKGVSNESISNPPTATNVAKPKDSKEKHCTQYPIQSHRLNSCRIK